MPPKKVTTPKVDELVPVTELVQETVEDVSPEPDNLQSILKKVSEIASTSKDLIAQLKVLQKDYVKMQKATAKKVPSQRKNPSGFAKPTKLSKELCEFLSLPESTELARTAVTKHINTYIMENNLQNPENKKLILADEKLTKLLNLQPTDQQLSYFNLQRYMKHLFV